MLLKYLGRYHILKVKNEKMKNEIFLGELGRLEQFSKIFHFLKKMKDNIMVMIRIFLESKIDFETQWFLFQIYDN